jgi:hypothetical protein
VLKSALPLFEFSRCALNAKHFRVGKACKVRKLSAFIRFGVHAAEAGFLVKECAH